MNLEVVKAAFLDELDKIARDLSTEAREHIAPKNFALSAKQSGTGKPGYPIEDKAHAANALSRVDQHGSPAQKSEVYKDVARKFPALARRSDVPAVREKAKAASIDPAMFKFAGEALKKFLHGAGEEVLPVAGAVLGSGVGKMLGVNQLATSAAGYGGGGLLDLALRRKAHGAAA